MMVSDANSWTFNHVVYNKANTPNVANYAIFMVNYDPTTGYSNWLWSDFRASFDFQPDTMIIRKDQSKWGGMITSSTL